MGYLVRDCCSKISIQYYIYPSREKDCTVFPYLEILASDSASLVPWKTNIEPEEDDNWHYFDGFYLSQNWALVYHLIQIKYNSDVSVYRSLRVFNIRWSYSPRKHFQRPGSRSFSNYIFIFHVVVQYYCPSWYVNMHGKWIKTFPVPVPTLRDMTVP